eukprot:355472-Chlamydomonas_euryale.AAC.3
MSVKVRKLQPAVGLSRGGVRDHLRGASRAFVAELAPAMRQRMARRIGMRCVRLRCVGMHVGMRQTPQRVGNCIQEAEMVLQSRR